MYCDVCGKAETTTITAAKAHHPSDNITITFIWHFAAVLDAVIS